MENTGFKSVKTTNQWSRISQGGAWSYNDKGEREFVTIEESFRRSQLFTIMEKIKELKI